MIEKVVTALHEQKVRRGAIDAAKIGLATGFITAFAEAPCGDLSLLVSEAINTFMPTAGGLMLGYLNAADKTETAAGILSANIFHRIAYYGTKGAFALLQYS